MIVDGQQVEWFMLLSSRGKGKGKSEGVDFCKKEVCGLVIF